MKASRAVDAELTGESAPPADPATAREAGPGAMLGVRAARVGGWVVGVAAVIFVFDLLGVPVTEWIHDLFQSIRAVPAGVVVGGVVLDTGQTLLAAISWLTILRVAYPEAQIRARVVIAAYAAAVALNGFLPANIGTLVMMIMFVSLIAGATFAAILSGFVVQKIPFSVFNVAAYIYLFATVSGSLSIDLGFVARHPVATVVIAAGGVLLLVLVGRLLWRRATGLRAQVKSGGAVLGQPRRFMLGVALPQFGSYLARLGIIAVFLAGYSIPVTFHTVVAVAGANSVSNSVSVTPGGVGVTQAMNVAVLESVTTRQNATAYSVAQQLIISAWDVVFGVAMMAWVFGWSGGKALVQESYAAAAVKRDELREQRRTRRAQRTSRLRRKHRPRGGS